MSENIRQSKFAGTWYTDSPNDLACQIEGYVDKAQQNTKKNNSVNVTAIIAPHAGLNFSGQTAGYAYLNCIGHKYDNIFILGPSHYVYSEKVILSDYDSFKTPLGNLKLNKSIINNLVKNKNFEIDNQIHANEHSIELNLPFISKYFSNSKIIPMIIGKIDDEDRLNDIACQIKFQLTENSLIIISSDFTHYGPRFNYQPYGMILFNTNAIKELDLKAYKTINQINFKNFKNYINQTQITICGMYPIMVLLKILDSNSKSQLLYHTTSCDVTKKIDQNSVSYMAINFMKDNNYSELANIAKQALELYIKENKILHYNNNNPKLNEKLGSFVTLYSTAKGEKELRGCIGCIESDKPLYQNVIDNTISSATKDPRFNPVSKDELNKILIEISVLNKPQPITDYHLIRLGIDGIIMEYSNRRAVFLPKVATEFGWSTEETIEQLVYKMGLSKIDITKAKFSVFQCEVVGD